MCATCWTALWHLDALCYEKCEGHGSANGLPQPRMELAERYHEQTYLREILQPLSNPEGF